MFPLTSAASGVQAFRDCVRRGVAPDPGEGLGGFADHAIFMRTDAAEATAIFADRRSSEVEQLLVPDVFADLDSDVEHL